MKYNDNGTVKEIKVKSFDTLPVGTEVDYEGSVVPSGWTEVNPVYGIIESGSNANGNYIKFADGTLIQYTNTSKNITIDGSYNNSRFTTTSVELPISFINNNYIAVVTPLQNGKLLGTTITSQTVNGFGIYIWTQDTRTDTIPLVLNTIAIGRWK